jgi:ABC-2 type transport system ATP-binding protein
VSIQTTGATASSLQTTPGTALDVRDLVKDYPPRIRALHGVSMTVREGEVYGVLGPNGAGKTTMIGVCTTLVKPTSGRVSLLGHDVVRQATTVRELIGAVLERYEPDRSCTVRQNLYTHCRYFGMGHRQATQRTAELLQAFALTPYANLTTWALSTGMTKHLLVARSMAHRPRALFLDEPTTGLDPSNRLSLWDRVMDMRSRDGVTVVLSTHHMDEAERYCDKVVILNGGNIVAAGTPGELKRCYGAQTLVRATVADPGQVDVARIAGLPGVETVQLQPQDSTVWLRLCGEGAGLGSILDALQPAHPRDVRVTEPGLENAFLELTQRIGS